MLFNVSIINYIYATIAIGMYDEEELNQYL